MSYLSQISTGQDPIRLMTGKYQNQSTGPASGDLHFDTTPWSLVVAGHGIFLRAMIARNAKRGDVHFALVALI